MHKGFLDEPPGGAQLFTFILFSVSSVNLDVLMVVAVEQPTDAQCSGSSR